MSEMKDTYDESDIQILEGLEAVRKRPGMYIGSTDSRGLHHLVWEIFDNAMDEALAGYGDEIAVTIFKDGSIQIEDHGRGIPIGMHSSGIPTVQVIMTVLHAGGKFSDEGGYKRSGGLHGVGASVVNALSEWLEVTVHRDGRIVSQRYEKGATKIYPLRAIGKARDTGTTVRFLPDPSVFSDTVFRYSTIRERLMESAFVMKGLKILLEDQRTGKSESFQYETGLEAFVQYLNKGRKPLCDVISISDSSNGIEVEAALQFSDSYQDNIISFVNLVKTPDGGSHETGFRSGLTRAFNEYGKKYDLIRNKSKKLDGSDIREGLTAVLSVGIDESILEFEGQTKGKLGTSAARSAVESVVASSLGIYLEEHKDVAEKLLAKMNKAARAREAARKARENSRKSRSAQADRILSGKLAPAQSKDRKKKELYLVEGDSAGGSAKQGRDRKYQAILPLRGKVINAERASTADILRNEEIGTMITTIGAGYGSSFKIEKAQYNKIIIMTDADTDGAHIQILLLTFFYRYMKDLIAQGHVYIAMPPLYKVFRKQGKKEKTIYAWNDEELGKAKKEIGRGYSVQRYKGLGEMNSDQLWETTMNPDTRTLIQVTIDDAAVVEHRVSVLMGSKVEPRREWIEKNVQFTMDDSFYIS